MTLLPWYLMGGSVGDSFPSSGLTRKHTVSELLCAAVSIERVLRRELRTELNAEERGVLLRNELSMLKPNPEVGVAPLFKKLVC